MSFKRIIPTRPVRAQRDTVSISKSRIGFSSGVLEELQIGNQYPFVSFAYDQKLHKLAIMRHATKRVGNFKVNRQGSSIQAPSLLRELKEIIPFEENRKFEAVRMRVMDVEAVVIDLNTPLTSAQVESEEFAAVA